MLTSATQCMWGVLDPSVSEFSLSLYRHPFLYTLFSSLFTLIINNNFLPLTLLIHNKQLPPPRTLIMDFTMTHKILHYRQLYIDRPDPIAFMSLTVDTSDRIYDDFLRLLFLHVHREVSALANDLPEESSHFRFLRDACLANIKWSVGLFLAKASAMRISIPLDLSSRPFIPPPFFILSKSFTVFLTLHSFSVTLLPFGLRLFLFSCKIYSIQFKNRRSFYDP